MTEREDKASAKFSCTVRERAVFESGIKLATIYHQFVGTPVDFGSVNALEKSIGSAIKVQPYVKDAKVRIDLSCLKDSGDVFSYTSLTGDMIDAVVTIEVEGVTVTSEMRYDEEIGYPLMYVSKIDEKK